MQNIISNLSDQLLGQRETVVPTQPIVDTTKTMQALVWMGAKDVRCVEKPKPCITDAGDIILKVTATSICGSDLHMYTGSVSNMKAGDILGHEFMGLVAEKGPNVRNLEEGQRVVVSFVIACGECEFCQREEYSACKTTNPSNLEKEQYGHRTAAMYGYSHLTGGVPGGQAEYVRVPLADINCLPIPDDVPDEKALYLSDVIPTAFHGVELGEVKRGSTVGIWGLGPIGLMVARWCQIRGASKIIGIDCVPERLRLAKNQLGIDILDFKEVKVLEQIARLFPDGLDVGIECVGFEYATTWRHTIEMVLKMETDTADILTEIFTCVRPFGHVAVLGVYMGTANHFPVGTMMEKSLTVRSGQCPVQKYWKSSLKMLQSGELDPTFIVSHKAPLSEGPELYAKAQAHEEGVIKVLLRPEQATVQT